MEMNEHNEKSSVAGIKISKLLFWLILIIIIIVFIGNFMSFQERQHGFCRELCELQILQSVLMYYVEENKGCLPSGWNDLASAGMTEPISDDGKLIIHPIKSKFQETFGDREIDDIRRYNVAFGSLPRHYRWIKVNSPEGTESQLLIAPSGKTIIGLNYYISASDRIMVYMEENENGFCDEEEQSGE